MILTNTGSAEMNESVLPSSDIQLEEFSGLRKKVYGWRLSLKVDSRSVDGNFTASLPLS